MMDPREFSRGAVAKAIALSDAPGFRITLTMDIVDAQALWAAAFAEGISAPGATLHDVIETIGPREDPVLADCLAMLLHPSTPAGCAIERCRIDILDDVVGRDSLRDIGATFPPAAWMAT